MNFYYFDQNVRNDPGGNIGCFNPSGFGWNGWVEEVKVLSTRATLGRHFICDAMEKKSFCGLLNRPPPQTTNKNIWEFEGSAGEIKHLFFLSRDKLLILWRELGQIRAILEEDCSIFSYQR